MISDTLVFTLVKVPKCFFYFPWTTILVLSIHPGHGKSVNICFLHKKINYYSAFNKTCIMAAKAKVQLKLHDVFEDFNNFVNMNGSIYR